MISRNLDLILCLIRLLVYMTRWRLFLCCRGQGEGDGSSRLIRKDRQLSELDVRDQPGASRPGNSVLVQERSHHPATSGHHGTDSVLSAPATSSHRHGMDRTAHIPTSHLQSTTIRFRQLHVCPNYCRSCQR